MSYGGTVTTRLRASSTDETFGMKAALESVRETRIAGSPRALVGTSSFGAVHSSMRHNLLTRVFL